MIALLGIAVFAIGLILMTVASIWGIVLAFQESAVWGLLYLFAPFAALVFIIVKWSKKAVRNSFFLGLVGLFITVGGGLVSLAGSRSIANRLENSVEAPQSVDVESGQDEAIETPMDDAAAQPQSPSPAPGANPDIAPASPPAGTAPAPPPANTPSTYHQTMMVGYAAYEQGDYQTALINFRRALDMQPGDRLATEAIQNTEAIIRRQRGSS